MELKSEQQPEPQNEHFAFLDSRGGGVYDGDPSWITSTVRDDKFLASVNVLEELKESWKTPVTKASWEDIKKHFKAVIPNAQIIDPQPEILTVRFSTKVDTVELHYDESGREIFCSPFEGCTIYYKYDDDGYLTEVRQSQYGGFGHQDQIEYAQIDGVKEPVRMTRRLFNGKGGGNNPAENMGPPFIVDLQNLDTLRAEPQPPQLPSIEEIKEMPHEIKEITLSENYTGIRCSNWQEVLNLLKIYGRGDYKGGRATFEHDRVSYDQAYGEEGEVKFAEKQQYESDDFVDENFGTEENPDHPIGWKYERKFDYDGEGGFYKSRVITEKTKDGYILKLIASYFGDKVEEQLAQATNKPRGMSQVSVRIRFNAGDYFFVDFQEIIEKLQRGGLQIDGRADQVAADYATNILESKGGYSYQPEMILESTKDYEVFMRAEIPDRNRFFKTKDGERDLWQSSGGAVFGPKEIDMRDETRTMLPSVTIGVRVRGDLPTFEPELQEKLREKSRQISKALKLE